MLKSHSGRLERSCKPSALPAWVRIPPSAPKLYFRCIISNAPLIYQSNLIIIVLDSKQKGNLTELQCITAFIAEGCTVSIPYGDCAKYDFIIDFNGQLFKI